MSERNRVTPTGDIVAIPLRGAWLGNRGILHRGHDIVRFHASPLWITCALSFKDWRAPKWEPHRYTALFFHDEAVSLAAGHRPCALCRRPAYNAFRQASAAARGVVVPSAAALDRQLHGERIVRGTHRRRLHPSTWDALPTGTFVLTDGTSRARAGRRGGALDDARLRLTTPPAPQRSRRRAHPAGQHRGPDGRLRTTARGFTVAPTQPSCVLHGSERRSPPAPADASGRFLLTCRVIDAMPLAGRG